MFNKNCNLRIENTEGIILCRDVRTDFINMLNLSAEKGFIESL